MSALFCGIAIIGTISYIRLHKHCYHYNFLKDRWVICLFIIIINCKKLLILKEKSAVIEDLQTQKKVVLKNTENTYSRQKNLKFSACLKNHSRNLRSPFCGIFYPNSVAVTRATTPSSGQNFPQIVTHILQKAYLELLYINSWQTYRWKNSNTWRPPIISSAFWLFAIIKDKIV